MMDYNIEINFSFKWQILQNFISKKIFIEGDKIYYLKHKSVVVDYCNCLLIS